MIIEKEDLVNMIMGVDPSYQAMDDNLIKKVGIYTGGFVEKWDWNRTKLMTLTNEQLEFIYTTLKKLK